MSHGNNRYVLNSIIIGIVSILVFYSCEELEPINPADPAYTLKSPTLVSAQAITDIQIDLIWQNNEEHTEEFVIQRKSGAESYSSIANVTKDILSFSDTSCTLGILYDYAIVSQVESNSSDRSNELTRTTVFPGPSDVTVQLISDEDVKLSWIDNCGFEDGFHIERDAGDGFNRLADIPANDTSFMDNDLNYGIAYTYRIAGYTSSNIGSWTNSSVTNMPFQGPTNLMATPTSYSTIELSWTDNCSFELGYAVERGYGGEFVQIATAASNEVTFVDEGLTLNSIFDYRVRAFTSQINSDYSNTATAIANPNAMIDIDGNIYTTIQIGTQMWMAENLKVTHYRDGSIIPRLIASVDWGASSIGAYCAYNNDASNESDTTGYLYNWYAVDELSGLAPDGWHVPSDSDWKELELYLGMNQSEVDQGGMRGTNEGSKLAGNTDLWNNGQMVNDSEFGLYGFNAIPGGERIGILGSNFTGWGNNSYFWTSTLIPHNAWLRGIKFNSTGIGRYNSGKQDGFSVRCVKD